MLTGIFQILHTPFREDGAIDWSSFERQIEYSIKAGAHGLVAPAMASEFFSLSDAERREVVTFAIDRVGGRTPVVACVQGVTGRHARSFAEHAISAGADAIMAMPPYLRHADKAHVARYYVDLSGFGVPLIAQNAPGPIGTPMSPKELADLASKAGDKFYVKEETPPILQRVTRTLELSDGAVAGIFGGANGLYLVDELDRSACGNMPAGGLVDLQVKVFNLYQDGDVEAAQRLQDRLLGLLTYAAMYGVSFHKHVLWKRGVIASATVRDPQASPLDAEDERTIAARWQGVSDDALASYPFVT